MHGRNAFRHVDQNLPKLGRGSYPMRVVLPAALECQLPGPLAVCQPVLCDSLGRKLRLADAPPQLWQINPYRVKQGRLSGIVTISTLFNATGPTPFVGLYPSAMAGRRVDVEVRPSMASPWMLQNTAPFADRRKRRFKASGIIALYLALTCPLDP
jgi:hypothetical protein